jgi:hypothetical protein
MNTFIAILYYSVMCVLFVWAIITITIILASIAAWLSYLDEDPTPHLTNPHREND